MSLYKQFKTDEAKEINGIQVEYPEAINDDGTVPTFTIARMSRTNKKFAASFELESRPYRAAMDAERMPQDISNKIALNVFCATILIGWHNVYGEDGKLMPYTKENAIALMTDLADLYNELQAKAGKAELYKPVDMVRDAKN